MNTQQRRKAMRFILGLVLFGALLFWWTPLQTTGLLIIMFCGGFALREMMEPIRKVSGLQRFPTVPTTNPSYVINIENDVSTY